MEEKKKTILYLCNCGKNIAEFINMDELQTWAKSQGNIDAVEIHDLLCAPNGKSFFKEKLNASKAENVIIAACSPKMHEATFSKLAEEASVNSGRVLMANIREQCSWVTKDKEHATKKAKHLISAALAKAPFLENIEHRSLECLTDLLIIGGGVAGIEAAITASRAGRKVYIVDKNISLGGHVITTEEVAPHMECAPCMLAPRLAMIKNDPNIQVITNAEVKAVRGFKGNFEAKIKVKKRYIENSCIGCEACFPVCPVERKSEFHLGMGSTKAVYTLFPGSVPAAAIIDDSLCKHFSDKSCNDACVKECPFGSINFEQTDSELIVKVGAVVVASGFDSFNPAKHPSTATHLKYGELNNVYTINEFERLAASNGPSGGRVLLKDGTSPKNVAVIHCVGSRREDILNYCSGTCCVSATKVGHMLRKQDKEIKVINVHNDLSFATPEEYSFYTKERTAGTDYRRSTDQSAVKLASNGKAIKVSAPGITSFDADMVILATGAIPAKSTPELASLLNIETDKFGFFKSASSLLEKTLSTIDGIHVVGSAQHPASVGDSIALAHSATAEILSSLMPGRKIELEVATATIDKERCAGCKLCISVCPYSAVVFNSEKKISEVIEAICRGCGTCTASCPSGASKARMFTNEQIAAEIGGLFK